MGADPGELAALLDAVRPRTDKPLIVKLTPNCASPADVAAAAEAARRRRRLADQHAARHGDATRTGRASRGSAAAPAACPGRPSARSRSARSARSAQRVALPIVGHGRASSPDATRSTSAQAGADLVGVGTESFRDPLAAARIAAEASRLDRRIPCKRGTRRWRSCGISTKCVQKPCKARRLPSTPLHAASPQLEVEANSSPAACRPRERM